MNKFPFMASFMTQRQRVLQACGRGHPHAPAVDMITPNSDNADGCRYGELILAARQQLMSGHGFAKVFVVEWDESDAFEQRPAKLVAPE